MNKCMAALFSGVLFGFGLGLSQMIDRNRVQGFLDVAGNWDPTLMFVLGGAVGVTAVTFRLILRRGKPLFEERFLLPPKRQVDVQLMLGAAIFGVGWGIAGYCPGPGLASLVLGTWNPVLFVITFAIGTLAAGYLEPLFRADPNNNPAWE